MILVTGAAGKTGRAVIRALTAQQKPVRALVRKHQQIDLMKALGAGSVVVGDMRSREILQESLRGIQSVYYICPNVHPEELVIGRTLLETARTAGIERFVYHSVLHPQIEAMPHHWLKMRVEEAIFESGIPFTILQPAAYMQNILVHWDLITGEGAYPIPYGPETKMSMVDLADIAETAARVLSEAGHEGAIYELCGPEVLSQTEVANIIAKKLDRSVRIKTIPISEWELKARKSGMSDYQIKTLVRMFEYYDRYGFCGNSRVLENLLGCPPARLEKFIERTIPQ